MVVRKPIQRIDLDTTLERLDCGDVPARAGVRLAETNPQRRIAVVDAKGNLETLRGVVVLFVDLVGKASARRFGIRPETHHLTGSQRLPGPCVGRQKFGDRHALLSPAQTAVQTTFTLDDSLRYGVDQSPIALLSVAGRKTFGGFCLCCIQLKCLLKAFGGSNIVRRAGLFGVPDT